MDSILDQSNAGDSSHPMDFLLAEEIDVGIPEAGEIRPGIVVEHLPNAILIDIGAKSEGIIGPEEMSNLDKHSFKALAVGNEVDVYIVDPEDAQGNIILSYIRAAEVQDWNLAQSLHDDRDTYEGQIVGCNKGGLLVQVGLLRGFVPVSQLGPKRRINRKSPTIDQLRPFVGQKMTAKVIEVDRTRNRLILSERAATREIREAKR